jgi:signal peptidase I
LRDAETSWPSLDAEASWPAHPAEPDTWPVRNGETVAWPPPRTGDTGGWSPPVIRPDDAPPASVPPRGGEAAGWAPPGSTGARARETEARGGQIAGRAATSGRAAASGSGGAGGRRGTAADDDPEEKPRRKSMPLWQELPLLLVVAFCLAVLIRTFLLQAFYIPSGSMENTLLIGDRVLVNKVVYDVRDPKRGEVVVFKGPSNWVPEAPTNDQDDGFLTGLGRTVGDLVGISTPGEKDFIKRVIGLPGDTVACCDGKGRVTVNGTPLDEPYVTENSPLDAPPSDQECRSRKFGPVKVEEGQLFVMGDHRLISQDSRCQGQVPIGNVIGRAFVIVWPNSRWGGLPVPATFGKVAEASGAGRPVPKSTSESATPGTVAVLLPLALSWYIPSRSRHSLPPRRRRLAQ